MLIVETNMETSCPLSFAQEGLWFLHKLESDSSAYNICRLVTFKGELNVEALHWSLNRIIERHETLRTSFGTGDETPCQFISSHAPLQLEVEDFSHMAHRERRAAAVALAHAEAERPFDLRQAPLLRARLLKLAPAEQVLVLCVHHIVCDGWSVEVLFSELEQFYNSACTSVLAQVAELPIQYADYAIWQRDWLQGEVLDEQLHYWREQLSGAEAVLELPVDHARPAVQSYRGGVEQRQLSDELSKGLQQLAQQQGATLFMVLLAAFQTLLWRCTGQQEIVVGTPVVNRQRVELEGLIGLLVNVLALRSRISGDESFVELLAQVKETCLSGYAHQELPFEKLVQELQPERSLAHSPLFQVLLTMQGSGRTHLNLHQLETQLEVIHNAASKRDLSLYVDHEPARGLKLWLEYNAELFEPITSQNFLAHYEILLQGLVANPAQQIAALPLLTKSERREILLDWNNTRTDFPLPHSLHELFEAQVEKTPDHPAVTFEGTTLNYRELNCRTNQLAHHLRRLGAGPESLVGVLMERSSELVIALLAVLKAGAAYVPLEPSYPAERLSFMLADCDAHVVLTQGHLRSLLSQVRSSAAVTVVAVDEEISLSSAENLTDGAGPDNLAYVIFTSGSTGRPKGAMNTHAAICNRLLWMQNEYELSAADCVLQKTPFSFDVSVWEFFWPLMVGARLVLARPEGHKDGAYLVELIREQRITALHFVPSMLAVFLEEPEVETLDSIKLVVCSGEALSFELQERYFARLQAPLYNLYGPTEAAVEVTYHACERGNERRTVPIGRPVANTQIYLLDRCLQPVPVGVAGELYIGGLQLARGYLNRPDLTAEKFIPNPFSDTPGARLYRTGDLARFLADGSIEYLGRLDFQVKLRGFRIELTEIEAVLGQHEAIANCVVVAREDAPGDQRLVAYIVCNGRADANGDLRSYLSEKLPQYMVPSAFVKMAELPLTMSGKVDRRALPAPEFKQENEGAFVAPRNQTELELTEIWSELLRIENVGVQDNFFELGGHSLLATQMVSRILNTFAVELMLQDIFNEPTVEAIAVLIDSALIEMSGDSRIDEALTMLEKFADDEVRGW